MSETEYAIEVTNLVKDFRVYHRRSSSLKGNAAELIRRTVAKEQKTPVDIRRALDGVSLRINRGESVGLIGRNGSGKSTLLSILSRVYLPTEGEARVRGRMMSLLELGAGFHPELTGNDNIFFNGAMMGLSEEDILNRYDAVLAFSGLDPRTMDLPVRMYSSGMQLRLGFSIAVHLDADVLLIDEGLAVGDEGFQEKCFAKIEEFRDTGKTILMVTHELDHIERLGHRVVWLNKGKIVMDGDVGEVLEAYRADFKVQG